MSISYLIKNQFPEFYQSEGAALIDFITAYYEWMDTVVLDSEGFEKNKDIDTISSDLLVYYNTLKNRRPRKTTATPNDTG